MLVRRLEARLLSASVKGVLSVFNTLLCFDTKFALQMKLPLAAAAMVVKARAGGRTAALAHSLTASALAAARSSAACPTHLII